MQISHYGEYSNIFNAYVLHTEIFLHEKPTKPFTSEVSNARFPTIYFYILEFDRGSNRDFGVCVRFETKVLADIIDNPLGNVKFCIINARGKSVTNLAQFS